jgi:hypothetical protein
MGIEPMTSSLPRKRSTPELRRLIIFKGKSPKIGTINSRTQFYYFLIWAGDQVRTGDLQLGRLSLYQLSYTRLRFIKIRGGRRIRTFEDISQRIYSPSQLATLVSPLRTLFITGNLWKELQNYTDFLFIPIFDLKYLKILLSPVKIIFIERSS